MVLLQETFPNFVAETTEGEIDFYKWLGDSWGILFSHPNDFTPVCTTELARVVQLMPEFQKLGVKIIAMSCNTIDSHQKWIEDIKSYGGITENGFPFPIIADESRQISTTLGMLDPAETNKDGLAVSARAVYLIDPTKKMRSFILYPATLGRNFDEILRAVESLHLTDKHKVATPADWKRGESVMVDPSVPEDQAKTTYGNDLKIISVPSGKQYLRVVPQPNVA